MFTFQYQDEDLTITHVVKDAVVISDTVDAFRKFLLAVGYHPNNVAEEIPLAP